MKVAVTGATGFVGRQLVQALTDAKHEVLVLSRNAERAQRFFPAQALPQVACVGYAPLESGDWQAAIAGCDAVVNLAGDPIAEGRWTTDKKQSIHNSRSVGTQKLVEAIAQANPQPQVLINASAIGYYGTSETASFDETSPSGADFLASVCQDWEAAAIKAKDSGTRVVILRFGIVVGQGGGAIAKMIPPFQIFAGGPLGDGQQWFSWIHRQDVVGMILAALNDPNWDGVYNATAPNPMRMQEVCSVLGTVLNRPSWLPVPGFALELLLGEGAQVVLEGQQVLPKRAQANGFQFKYSDLKPALEQVVHGATAL